MKKRTCGTCGYFQESDISGCGWCVHPQRRVTTDLKIMVRRGELACRDGWSRDLWAPAGEPTAASPLIPSPTGPVAPVTAEEMSQLVGARYVTLEPTTKSSPSVPVDVVVGETPAPPVAEDRATLLSHDPRAAIEAARKRHLANLQGAAADPHADSQASLNRSGDYTQTRAPFVTSTVQSQSSPARTDVPTPPVLPRYANEPAPVGRDEIPRDSSGLVSFRSDEAQFSSVPDIVAGTPLPRRDDVKRISLVAGESFEHDDEIAPTRVKAPRRWMAERDVEEVEVAAFAGDLSSDPEPVPENIAELAPEDEYEWPAEVDETYDEPEPYYEEPAPKRRRWQPSFRFERPSRRYQEPVDEWESDYAYDDSVDDRIDELGPVEPAYAEADPTFSWHEQDDRIDMTIEASPTVPRACRTCRDFRPADNGGRGWCTNKWAFSHRRMVDADELPCETSLGCWWLPHDEVWLSVADAASHTEPTPLVDHWLGRRERVSAAAGTRRR